MATANSDDTPPPITNTITAITTTITTKEASTEEPAVNALQKRYEGLVTIRTRALKGKGAWYWSHLEPTLLQSENGVPKAVKLRCLLCFSLFSASNPSRTAAEHLKRGTCPNYTSAQTAAGPTGQTNTPPPQPISSIPPPPNFSNSCGGGGGGGRKRPSSSSSYQALTPLAMVDPTAADVVYSSSSTPPPPPPPPQQQHLPLPHLQHLVLSGGREDLDALALLEHSVKKLKSPNEPVGPTLPKSRAESAISLLADWFYESSGSVSFSSVEHPKFRAFLHRVGLPLLSRRELVGARLEARYDEARLNLDARIREALFFQIAADGWSSSESDALVSLTVNLPNGTTVFRRLVHTPCHVPSKYVEEILWETLTEISGNSPHRCAGIVADKFKSKALRSLETQNHWMVNLSCQLQGLRRLIKDFAHDVPLFTDVISNCSKIANLFNADTAVRSTFQKFQLEECDHSTILRSGIVDTDASFEMIEDIVNWARPIQLTVHCDSFKAIAREDSNARELEEMIRGMAFWNEIEAVHSLIKQIKDMGKEMEVERPLVSQCLPIWEELRSRIRDWCAKFSIEEEPVMKTVEKRFKNNYHPAWAAAFILDPFYLIKDSSGKYLPPFKYLNPEQEKDVDKLITRLVSREEAHIVLMELMKWRSEGLDPLYAQAVQMKKFDSATGKMKVVNPQSSRLVWETTLSEEFRSLSKVAVRLIFLHATSGGYKCNLSMLRWVRNHGWSRAGMDRAQKMVFVAAHAKLERKDYSNDEEKDAELFANEEDDVINEGFVDSSSV